MAGLFGLVRGRVYRIMPPRRANALGLIAVVVILVVVTRGGILDRVIVGLDESCEAAQALFDQAPPAPTAPVRPGSAASFIDWAAMGTPGRDFIMSGPDAEAIAAFTGRPARDPIRVYVGRANRDTPQERAELALAGLRRLGAFEREVLIVASPTGTGRMDPGSHDPVEYITRVGANLLGKSQRKGYAAVDELPAATRANSGTSPMRKQPGVAERDRAKAIETIL